MSKRASNYNPMADDMFEVLADAMLLRDSAEHQQELIALQVFMEEDPFWANLWEESHIQLAIDEAYRRKNLKLLKTALENRLIIAGHVMAEVERVRTERGEV